MNSQEYQAFTDQLVERLAADARVLGLVAAGSMAAVDYMPDRWSDHDFWVITEGGAQAHFRSDFSWLPQSDQIVLAFQETAHGMKVVYASGHLLEYAVFEPDELVVARINSYRLLLDRADLAARLAAIQQQTRAEAQANTSDPGFHLHQLLTNLLVGAGRYARGERLSGHRFVKEHAVHHLLWLLSAQIPPAVPAALDNIDPFRRFEQAFPALGAEINACLLLPVPQAALELLDLVEQSVQYTLPDYPETAAQAVRRALEVAAQADSSFIG
jgi:hypothetical protein